MAVCLMTQVCVGADTTVKKICRDNVQWAVSMCRQPPKKKKEMKN